MTIDQVRDAVRTDTVRRLVESAPSADEVRSAISEGLEVLGDGIGTVAGRVDQSAESLRERVVLPEPLADLPERLAALPVQLGLRPAPRRGIPPPVAIAVGLVLGLVVTAILIRLGRRPFDAARQRLMPVVDRAAKRAGLSNGIVASEPGARQADTGAERGARPVIAVDVAPDRQASTGADHQPVASVSTARSSAGAPENGS